KDDRYFNFPVQFLEGYFDNPKDVLRNILDYALYAHTLKYEHDSGYKSLITSAEKYFSVQVGSKKLTYDNGEDLFNSIPESCPKVGIRWPIFWDFYNNDKTDFEHACLLGFLAIKSILLNKPYCKVTNNYWWARMDGKAKSVNDISE